MLTLNVRGHQKGAATLVYLESFVQKVFAVLFTLHVQKYFLSELQFRTVSDCLLQLVYSLFL